MASSDKAQRALISLGPLEVEGFQMPDGSYRMSQSQAAAVIGLSERNAREFLQSKGIKALLGERYTPAKNEIEVESKPGQIRGQTRIRALGLEEVSAYWLWQTYRGNKAALALCMALMTESLERRFDTAFGMQRSEGEYNSVLAERLQRLEGDLQRLGDAYAEIDLRSEREARLEQQIRDLGGEPWQLPPYDNT